MVLYIDSKRLRTNDQAAAAASTQGVVDDVQRQYQQATEPPEPQYALPDLAQLGVSNAPASPSPVMQAIGALPRIGQQVQQRAQEAVSWALPTLESLGVTPPAAASGTPAAMPSAGSATGGMAADGSQSDSGSVTQGPRTRINSALDVTPDEPVTSETVTRAAAAALTKAGLPADMAPYIAGIAINEGILQPGTIARDNWSVGGVKAPGSAGVVTVPTREVINGQSVMQTASFGTFNSMQEGMDALAEFVRDSPRFGPVAQQAAQTGDYSNLIAGFKERGYATDPNWVQQVNSIAAGLRAPRVQQAAPPADTMARIPLTAAPASSPAPAAAAPSPAATGVPPAPVAASPYPAAPWEGLQADAQAAPLLMKAGDDWAEPEQPAVGPGDGGYAPQTNEQPFNPDEGPREATPGSVGAQPLPQPAYADPTIGDASYTAPREPDPVQGPQQPAAASPVEQATNWVKDKLKPIYDAAGDVVGYVQAGADAVVQQAQSNMAQNRENVRVANASTGYGQVTSTPGEPDYVPPTTGPLTNAINTMVDPARNTYAETTSGVNEQQDALEARMNKADPNEFAQAARVPLDVINRGLKIANAVLLATPQAGADAINGALEAAGIGRATVGVTLPLVGRIGIADLIDLGPASNIGMARTGMVTRPAAIRGLNWGQNIEDAAGAVGRAGAGAARAGVEAVREGSDALGRGLQGVGREVAGGLLDLSPAARVIQESGGGMREIKPTVEVLQEQLDWTRSVIERARNEGNADLEKRAIDRAWQLESELVDARNARRGLEPAITSDQGRRIESLPLDERSADDFAGLGRERVSPQDAADLGGPASVVPERGGRANSVLPFDPASAALGAGAGAASEDEGGGQGDPLRTLGGAAFAGMAGRMARKPGHTFAFGAKPGERLEFRVKVVPLRDLITSHTDALTINRAFPSELQPRVRERTASKVQIDKIVSTFDPEQVLVDTHRVDSGPMIVGEGNVVESGNGRSIALRRLAKENPEAYAEYVQALKDELPRYGLTEDALAGIDQPVLVRERVTPMTPEERARYAADANVGVQARMAPVEQAMQDAGRISDDAVSRIVVGEDQTIDEALMAAENGGFRRAFMASVPESEWGELLTADGNLNPKGLMRVKDALLSKTYQGSAGARLATAFVDSLDSGIKNVQHGIMGSLPNVARAEARIAAGEIDPGLSIANDMAVAADVYSRLRRRKTILRDYIAQSGMFEGRETTPFQDRILAYLDENSRSPKRIRAMLDDYARTVDGMAGAEQTDMFGLPIPQATKDEVLDGVLRRLGTDPADQGADLGRVGAGSNVVEGAGTGAAPVPPAAPGTAPTGSAGGEATGPQLTAEQQLERFNRAQRTQAPTSTPAPATLRAANLPPVADDLIPSTGGEAGELAVQGAPTRPVAPTTPVRPGPVGNVLPATGGPEGVLQVEGAPQRVARPGPVGDIVPRTGGEAGTLAQEGVPVPLARPTPIPRDVLPSTGGPTGELVQEGAPRPPDALAGDLPANNRPLPPAVVKAQERARFLAERQAGRGQEPLSPLQWMRALAANIGYSSMIGPATATVNIFGNLLEPLWAIPKETARAVSRGNIREATTMAMGAFRGMSETGTAMLDAIMARGRYASNPDHPMLSAQTEHPLLKAIATGTELGGRVFSGMPDAIFGTIARSAGESRRAAQIATDEGLKGQAWSQRVKTLLGEVEQSRSGELTVFPTEVDDIIKSGEQYADNQTFRQQLGTVGRGASALAGRNIPVVGNLITPFFNTPWNMGVTLAERSPVGALMNRQKGFDKAYDALAGSALITGLVVGPAAAGSITGSGPNDPEKRKMLEAEGWKPYHTLVGDVYVPNRVFGIYGKLLNAVGEAHDAMAYQKKDGSVGEEALRRFGLLLKEEPYLQGLSDIMQAINAPNGSGLSSYGSSTLTRMIPYASTARAAGTALDPNDRVVDSGKTVPWQENVSQRVQQGVGLRSGLPVAQNVLGEPKENPQQGLRSILPALRDAKSEPLVRAYLDAGVDISSPPTDIDGVPLTPAQQRQYQQIMGRELRRIAGASVGGDAWKNTPPNVRKTLLETFQSTARTLAEVGVSSSAGPDFARQRAQKSVDKALGR